MFVPKATNYSEVGVLLWVYYYKALRHKQGNIQSYGKMLILIRETSPNAKVDLSTKEICAFKHVWLVFVLIEY